MDEIDELTERRLGGLRYALGPVIMEALQDPEVIEVMLNDDGKLFIETFKEKKHVGFVSATDAYAILSQVSSAFNGELNEKNTRVAGTLPFNGERFEGAAPPVVSSCIFAIRKKATKIFPLSSYVRSGVLSFKQSEVLRGAIAARKNILVVGGTGSGKTTFCNAIIDELSILRPHARMVILEDTAELQCALEDRVFLLSTTWTNMGQLSKSVNRLRPDSVTVGELLSGDAALPLLKLWNTGHPGGVTTVHADSAYKGLTRMDQLVQEVSSNPQRELISEAVNIVVYLEKRDNVRRVKEIIAVHGYDEIARKFIVEQIH